MRDVTRCLIALAACCSLQAAFAATRGWQGAPLGDYLESLSAEGLYEPYHLKDFQSVATIVNASAISGIDFYSGGYPVRYGDRMSGVMGMDMREPTGEVETEVAMSLFNASVLSLGRFGSQDQGDWLVAARRGNLDLIVDVVDPDYGSPDYQDLLLHFGWDFGPVAQVSANVLASHDKISLTDRSVGESANGNYDNRVFWIRWIASWSDKLQSETIVSLNDISDKRIGSVDMPGIVTGTLDETRDFQAYEIQQDWTFA